MNTIIEKIRAEIKGITETARNTRINGTTQQAKEADAIIHALDNLMLKISDLEKSEKPINPVIQDFPTTEKEMQDFLATHERIPVPERLNSLERILQEQPVCEGLEEEMEKFIETFGWGKTKHLAEKELISVTARHFAQWMREKMMKDGLNAVKSGESNMIEKTIAGVFVKYGMDKQKEIMLRKEGDKGKLLFVKED